MTEPLTHSDYPALKAAGRDVVLPEDRAELHALALRVICSRGVPCYLTPYGAIRSVAAFAYGATDDPFFNDGEVLLRAAVAAMADEPPADPLPRSGPRKEGPR